MWNENLAVFTRLLDSLGAASAMSGPAVKELQELLTSAQGDSTQQFEAVRRRVVAKVISRAEALGKLEKDLETKADSESKKLNALIASDHTAQIIVRQVNTQYPKGVLAEYK